jgi:drug/metabolite transporter (DMT)-like permease
MLFSQWIVIITFRGEKLAKLAILTISFSGVCVIFYDHLSDFQPDFRFGILLSFIATISWAFGSLYTKKKQLLSILILAWVTNADFKLDSFAVTGATGTGVNLMSIPAISWSIAYLVIIGSVLSFIAYIYMLQNLPAK